MGRIRGHCCEFSVWDNASMSDLSGNASSKGTQQTPGNASSKGVQETPIRTHLDGFLFFPEYQLLVDSPLGDGGPIDIHALSAIGRNFPGVYHGVVSVEAAAVAANSDVQPNSSSSSFYALTFGPNIYTLEIEVNLKNSEPKQVRQYR